VAQQQTNTYDRLVEAGFPRLTPPYYYRLVERPAVAGIAVQLRKRIERSGRMYVQSDTDPTFVDEVLLDTRHSTPDGILFDLAFLVADMVNRHEIAKALVGDFGPEASEAGE
jgi:hypothetical protein